MPKPPRNLANLKRYYLAVQDGKSKSDAHKEVFGTASTSAIYKTEHSDDYQFLLVTLNDNTREQIKKELDQVKLKKVRSYSKLISDGDELIEQAKQDGSLDSVAKAQENQRRNLGMQLVQEAEDWAGENRNQQSNDILDAIIID